LITFFFLGLALGLSLPATAFLHSSRLRSFGPYIQYGKKYVSLKEITPEEVTLNEALTLFCILQGLDLLVLCRRRLF
jgi:hypothetical protein